MGMLDFFKDAGEKLLGTGTDANPAANVESIKNYISKQGLSTEGLDISFDSVQNKVRLSGAVKDQETKEKIILCCGNIHGVSGVEDNLTVQGSSTSASQYYTVKSGDTLSKISKQFYGDPLKYNLIFDANRPMLSHPDKIYPGQSLRIPPAQTGQQKMASHSPNP